MIKWHWTIRCTNGGKQQISQDGGGQALLPHSLLSCPTAPHLAPRFVNTWLCDSWHHLQHCASVWWCTHLAVCHFCSVYLKSPRGCLMSVLWPCYGRIRDMLWLCLLGQPQENAACLLLQLLCQSGENKYVCSFYNSLSFLPALLFAYPGFSEQWYSKTHIHCTNVNFLVLILYSSYARCRI